MLLVVARSKPTTECVDSSPQSTIFTLIVHAEPMHLASDARTTVRTSQLLRDPSAIGSHV